MRLTHLLYRGVAICTSLCAFAAAEAAEEQLPVLEIAFDAPITATMDYAPGTMRLTDTDGQVTELKAKFQTRGATAKQFLMKPALNMKLRTDDYSASRDSSLLGMRSISSWILDAMAIDRICMRNRVCMDLWNEFSPLPYDTDFGGRSGTEGRFVELYINGDLYGIYCLSDKINRKLLDLKKYDEGKNLVRGVLYKSGTTDIANQEERNFTEDFSAGTVTWHNAWELKEPEDHFCMEAWQPLLDAHDNITTFEQVKKYFYIDNLVDHQLLVMALSIADNWGNKNHYFSVRNIQKDINDADPDEANRRKFVVSPWDLDTSLGGSYNGSCFDGDYLDWPVGATVANGGFFPYSLCQGRGEYMERLKTRWQELRNGALSEAAVNARLEAYRDLFVNSGAWKRMTDAFDARSEKPKYVHSLPTEIALIEEWYANRCAEMDEYFGTASIDQITADGADTDANADKGFYDLYGRHFEQTPTVPGIYVHRGKKIVVR